MVVGVPAHAITSGPRFTVCKLKLLSVAASVAEQPFSVTVTLDVPTEAVVSVAPVLLLFQRYVAPATVASQVTASPGQTVVSLPRPKAGNGL